MMQLVYALQKPDTIKSTSVFLAGPTPRKETVKSWRPDAIEIFKELKFDGTLLIPEPKDKVYKDYDAQVGWEYKWMNACTVILMWVPRDLDAMPAFTTNVEFGLYLHSGRLIYGRPDDSPNNRYLDSCYERVYNRKPISDLRSLVGQCSMAAYKS